MPYYPKYKASYNKVFRNRSLQQFIHSYKFVTFTFQIFPVFRNGTPYDKLTILYSSACSSSILIRFDFVCLDCGSMYVI